MYVGANDGSLHAFVMGVWDWDNQKWAEKKISGGIDPDTGTSTYAKFIGTELWAYVPSNLLGSLQVLASSIYGVSCSHRTMIDLSPQPFVIFSNLLNTDGNGPWRTVIVGGERSGGDVHFALDVTVPTSPVLIWEFSHIKDLVQWTGSSFSVFQAGYGESATYYPTSTINHFPHYDTDMKVWPMSWSLPTVGRVQLPPASTFRFFFGDPPGPTTTISTSNTANTETGFGNVNPFSGTLRRHVCFAGGGFRMFQTNLQFVDNTNVDSTGVSGTPNQGFLRLLRQPRMVAIDMETGVNLFRVHLAVDVSNG